MGRLPCAIKSNDNGKTDGDFRRCHGDYEKNKDLGVVIWNSGRIETEARKGNERKIGRVQHQLQRHEDDDDVTAQEHARETDREKQATDDEVMAQCQHAIFFARESREWTRMN